MAVRFGVGLRNARAASINTYFAGQTVTLQLRSGSVPGTVAETSGTLLATISLPDPCFSGDANNTKVGTWAGSGSASGNIGHFRIMRGSFPMIQGSVSLVGAGGDMTVSNLTVGVGSAITITSFGMTEGNV